MLLTKMKQPIRKQKKSNEKKDKDYRLQILRDNDK